MLFINLLTFSSILNVCINVNIYLHIKSLFFKNILFIKLFNLCIYIIMLFIYLPAY